MYAVYAFLSWAPLVLTSLGFELVSLLGATASGFFACIAVALLIATFAVLLARRQIAAGERYFAAGASTSGA